MKVFLDTNVVVSALIARGLCDELLRLLIRGHTRGRFELLIGAPVVDELDRILRDKLSADRETRRLASALLAEGKSVPRAEKLPVSTVPDPDDIPVLASALAAKADLFITGDKTLLKLGAIEGMAIVSPREAWVKLRAA